MLNLRDQSVNLVQVSIANAYSKWAGGAMVLTGNQSMTVSLKNCASTISQI